MDNELDNDLHGEPTQEPITEDNLAEHRANGEHAEATKPFNAERRPAVVPLLMTIGVLVAIVAVIALAVWAVGHD
jgi:hypothetical protein